MSFSILTRSSIEPFPDRRGGGFHSTRDRLLLAHQDRFDLAGVIAYRLDLLAAREGEFALLWLAQQRGQIEPRKNHFALHGFLPRLEQPVADFQLLDEVEDWLVALAQL